MDILIENLKNIDKLKIAFDDKKVNFVFGISGSGKTAISDALSQENLEDITQIGKKIDDVVIKIDGRERNLSSFKIYNYQQVDNLSLYSIEGEDAFDIVFANSDSYAKKVDDFEKLVSKLSGMRDKLMNRTSLIQKLLESQNIVKLIGKKKNELPAAAIVNKVREILSNGKVSNLLQEAEKQGQDKISWIKKGTNFEDFENKICPFCDQKIQEANFVFINELAKVDNSFFKGINEDSSIYTNLSLVKPDYFDKESLDQHADTMVKYTKVLSDLKNINDFLELNDIQNLDTQKLVKIEVSDILSEIFPDVAKVITETNTEISKIKIQLSQIKSQMKKVISTNIHEINNQLTLLGFKYRIIERPVKPRERKASFILKHLSDENETDRSKYLSTGEKNILALIFFLLKSKGKNLIIDDPASSFDDNRRKILYDLILKQSNERTIIVLSHDEVFTKYAIKSKYSDNNPKIGVIKYMSNYTGSPITKDIQVSDYNTLEYFAKMRIRNTTNILSLIINSRVIIEPNKNQDSMSMLMYGYLSAIIHGVDNAVILNELTSQGVSEQQILNSIRNVTGANIPNLSNYDRSITKTDDLSNFEKVFILREDVENGITRDEMSNIIHLNDRLSICLNPYVFDTFSPYLYQRIYQIT